MAVTKKTTTEEKVTKTVKPVKAVKAEVKVAAEIKVEKEVVEKTFVKASVKKASTKAKTELTVEVFDLEGKVTGKVTLPEEIFGEKVNKVLLAQAVRVYLANKRQGNASTKTRGEVEGSTRKIYRQKGTGRARHGSVRAPIFVHGGIVHGPKPRDFGLSMPQKMRRKALFSALSARLADGDIKVVGGFDAITPKTKEFVSVINKLGIDDKKRKLLLVMGSDLLQVKRAGGNVPGVSFTAAKRLNAYDVLNNKKLILMEDAISVIKKNFLKEE